MTYQAVAARSDPPKRPFVLTRAFYAGSQRFGAMWTGDNMGTWEHMAVGIKMVLANSIGGFSFAGSDVGGFFGNPEPEMLVRWYQVGAMAPFFRAHAHIDTKRREPYLLASPYKDIVYGILRLRYSMLPVWYTAFRETTVTGRPILRPQYVVFPKDKNGFDIDDQYFIGSSGLLVKPITEKDVTETTVYFSDDQVYYDYFTFATYNGKGSHVKVPAALHQLPLFIRGGSIVSTRERPRRASSLMKYDPFTLRVALSKDGEAKGDLYLDDGETYNHQNGEYVWREIVAEKKTRNSLRISSRDLGSLKPTEAVGDSSLTTYNPKNSYAKTLDEKDVRVEKILVLGLKGNPKSVKVEGTGEDLAFEFMPAMTRAASTLVIKDPRAKITDDWAVLIQY